MWSTLTDNLTTAIAVLSGLGTAASLLLRIPQRLVGFVVAVKERQTLQAMHDYEARMHAYWQAQAETCQQALDGKPR